MHLIPPVVEVSDAPRGLVELKVKDSHGSRIGFFQIASSDMDDQLIADLTAWQGRHTHESALSLMPSASVSA